MKIRKRNTSRTKKNARSGKALHRRRQKTSWLFEQLESRFAFSVGPLDTASLSNDTPEGAEAIWTSELEWAARQSSGTAPTYAPYSLPNDPYFANQWHLLNQGQEVGNPDFQHLFGVAGEDINVVPVWNMGYTGEGVVVAVLDTGVQTAHPDLIANLHELFKFNAVNGGSNANPSLIDPAGFHGTAVAGLIAATANNGIGGTGVAPGASIVPILFIGFPAQGTPNDALRYQWREIDITNNSWGAATDLRTVDGLTPEELTTLRDTVRFGRNGLGTIHVFASGNNGGPSFSPGFPGFGNYDSSSYNGWVNSRYTIGVTGVDHDGLYGNSDGSFTSYSEAGSSVLIAAPTGSNVAQNVADDTGQGSGIWTTDLTGNLGANALPDENGFEADRDFWPDPDYTSRFNGTSAAAPIVSGVIALMLEANPELTYRDVQEILVRSARQNAQFEQVPLHAPGLPVTQFRDPFQPSTWQTNQNGNFRNPDPYNPNDPAWTGIFDAIFFPLADPNISDSFFFGSRRGHYETQPSLFTNSAGFTVSQGYGTFGEQIGYGHGVIDAELAVRMAEQWHNLNQGIAPDTERTYTTFVTQPGASALGDLPAAEVLPPDRSALIIPGALGGDEGFSEYWSQYFEDDPFVDYDGPSEFARGTYLEFEVPDTSAINLEWAEVKVDISGPSEDLDHIRITLISPEGTQSELHNYYADLELLVPGSIQPGTNSSGWLISPAGDLDTDGGTFVWTFSTNRNWGERTSTAAIIDPITREPLLDSFGEPITRGWELHVENWSNSEFRLEGLEIVWHGKAIAAGTQRVQGLIGTDQNNDGDFNYSRSIQTITPSNPVDASIIRNGDVVRELDFAQEAFAANMLVEAFRVVNGVPEDNATARFLTGADGNYYFDLLPDEYVIRVTDPLERVLLEDVSTPSQFLRHYESEWHINEDWFFAQDREDINPLNVNQVPEVLYDAVLDAPMKFLDGLGSSLAAGIKNLNFLIKDPTPADEIVVNGTVFADINGNGTFDGDDAPHGGVFVYWDANRNGVRDGGELTVTSSEDSATPGVYTLTIPATAAGTFAIGVERPGTNWEYTNPDDGVQDVFARPGDIIGDITNADINDGDVNFFLDPPDDAFPPGGTNEPGDIFGVVFIDRDGDGFRDIGDDGIPGFQVYIDENENGVFDGNDVSVMSADGNGAFSFPDVEVGLIRVDIVHDASWQLTTPAIGYREVQLGPGGTVTGVLFGLKNLAASDWGDLPNSFTTLQSINGPSHVVVPGFHLGAKIDGEVNGIPSANADGDDAIGNDDDGVLIVSNGGLLQPGINTLQVTVAGLGGLLNGWIDFDGDGNFDDDPDEQVFDETDLNPGTYLLSIFAPQNLVGGTLGARFRWGEEGLSYTGPAVIGEVEDYMWASTAQQPLVLPGDYNDNGIVDDLDKAVWFGTFGSTTDLRADGNGDGRVDAADYTIIVNNFGLTIGIEGSSAESSGGGSEYVANSAGGEQQPAQPTSAASFVAWSPIEEAFPSATRPTNAGLFTSDLSALSRNAQLLDLALASLVTDDDETEARSERELFQDEDEEVSELALAVAWEDDQWWAN
ncbi:MAG: S8 family serine peptidase [Pirellulales bacterium]